MGNCTKSISFFDFLKGVSANVINVRGEFDNSTIQTSNGSTEEIPLNTIITQGAFRIGCCNGYTLVPKNDPLSLLTLARQLDVDILLWGGTHNVEAYTLEGKFFINPGSCTGAFSTDWTMQEVKENIEMSKGQDRQQEADVDRPSSQPENTEQQTQAQQQSENTNIEDTQEPNEQSSEQNNHEAPDLSSDDEDFDEVDINGGGVPSFCLLDLQDTTCTLYIYTYMDDEVKVDKVVYKKE